MLQVKRNPRRDTLRFSTDRTGSDFNSVRCPSPAGREAAASAAIPVGEGKIGNSSRFSVFAICSPKLSGYAERRAPSNRLYRVGEASGARCVGGLRLWGAG